MSSPYQLLPREQWTFAIEDGQLFVGAYVQDLGELGRVVSVVKLARRDSRFSRISFDALEAEVRAAASQLGVALECNPKAPVKLLPKDLWQFSVVDSWLIVGAWHRDGFLHYEKFALLSEGPEQLTGWDELEQAIIARRDQRPVGETVAFHIRDPDRFAPEGSGLDLPQPDLDDQASAAVAENGNALDQPLPASSHPASPVLGPVRSKHYPYEKLAEIPLGVRLPLEARLRAIEAQLEDGALAAAVARATRNRQALNSPSNS